MDGRFAASFPSAGMSVSAIAVNNNRFGHGQDFCHAWSFTYAIPPEERKNVATEAHSYRKDMWSHSSTVDESEPLHIHIDAL